MGTDAGTAQGQTEAVTIVNRDGAGRYLIVCDHASNHLPPRFGTLGLDAQALSSHIAWDPGASPVAHRLAAALDAPLVESRISRLVVDCNRPFDAPDLIVETSENTRVPGNVGLDDDERAARIALAHRPFHAAIEQLVEDRRAAGRESWIVSIHSFTPVYRGVARPWQIGIIHDDDDRLAAPMIGALRGERDLVVGVNEPYAPADRVYYTIERHARSRGLPCAMVEIRNDVIADDRSQRDWAERLARILSGIQEPDLNTRAETASNAKGRRRA